MTTKIGFRQAQTRDVEFLLALRKASMTEHLNHAGITLNDDDHLVRINEFFDDSHIILAAEQAIGLIKLGVMKDQIHIRQFQLLPKFHRLGIGSKVIELVKRKAIEKQLPVTLNVLLENPAKKLYLRHDFTVVESNELEFQMRWQLPQ